MTREEAIEVMKANYPDPCFSDLRKAVDRAINALEQSEIIRCRECKHYRELHDQDDLCVYTMTSVDADDYCSYAERKEGADG